MCGRYYLADVKNMNERFGFKNMAQWLQARYNIAPSQKVPAIIHDGSRRLVQFQWGLKPYWTRNKAGFGGFINARAETVNTKPSFRLSFETHRCLIPASGFYEWRKDGSRKIPYRIGLTGWEPFAFAGIWASWQTPGGDLYETCAIITTAANSLVAQIHQRMPVILTPSREETWLNPGCGGSRVLKELLQPYPAESMMFHRISPLVNSPANDMAQLLEPKDAGNQI